VYVIRKAKQDEGILSYWGFRRGNFWNVTKMVMPFGVFSIISFFAIGYFRDTINLSWHIVPILIAYPIWGVIQQFLVIALVAGNMQDLRTKKITKFTAIFTSAFLFGAVHYPFGWLMAGTFVLALFYGFIYLRARNLFVMGLFHGWLGGLFFYTVVERDPFHEVFGRLLNP
jgi:membrane protease YdiL (CAAX protease family)